MRANLRMFFLIAKLTGNWASKNFPLFLLFLLFLLFHFLLLPLLFITQEALSIVSVIIFSCFFNVFVYVFVQVAFPFVAAVIVVVVVIDVTIVVVVNDRNIVGRTRF